MYLGTYMFKVLDWLIKYHFRYITDDTVRVRTSAHTYKRQTRTRPRQTVIVVTMMRNLQVILVIGLLTLVRSKSVSKSGLQVEVTKEVKCKDTHKAVNGDKVTVHYGGFLQDGKIWSLRFESAFKDPVIKSNLNSIYSDQPWTTVQERNDTSMYFWGFIKHEWSFCYLDSGKFYVDTFNPTLHGPFLCDVWRRVNRSNCSRNSLSYAGV